MSFVRFFKKCNQCIYLQNCEEILFYLHLLDNEHVEQLNFDLN